MSLLRCKLGHGFTGWVAQHGEPILVNDANLDPRGATIAGTEDVDESILAVPMRYDGSTIGVITLAKLGLDGFSLGRPADPDDPRRPGRDRGRLRPAADPHPGPRPRDAPPPRHERRAVGQPRPAPGRRPDGRPPRDRDGRQRVHHQLLGPACRAGRIARLLPAPPDAGHRAVVRRGGRSPRRCASSNARSRSSSTSTTRPPTGPRSS